MQVQKSNITPIGYFLTLLSDDRTTRVDGRIDHCGDAKKEQSLLKEATDLLNKALKIGVEGIKNEKEQS